VNPSSSAIVFSCEHGGNDVPADFAAPFRSQRAQRALRGHRGYDSGALSLAKLLAAAFDVPLVAATVTRLLVDMNRAATNPSAFSEFSRRLAPPLRHRVIAEIHAPHRKRVADAIAAALTRHAHVYHVAVHSFTPRLGGVDRRVDIGLLYDPSRSSERSLCARWRVELSDAWPQLRVRRNFPYRGTTDGLPTHLRRVFDDARYSGIELEISQRLLRHGSVRIARALVASLETCLAAR